MTLKRLNTCKWFGLFLLFCLTTAIIACRVLIVPPPEGSTSAETTGAVDYTSTTRFKSDFMTSAQHSRRTSAKHDDWASTSVTLATPLPTFTAITTNGTATASTTAAKSSETSSGRSVYTNHSIPSKRPLNGPGHSATRLGAEHSRHPTTANSSISNS